MGATGETAYFGALSVPGGPGMPRGRTQHVLEAGVVVGKGRCLAEVNCKSTWEAAQRWAREWQEPALQGQRERTVVTGPA